MIKSDIILHNYIQAISFTLHNVNFTLINCYLPSGNTSTKILQRVKAIQNIISFLNNLDFRHRKLIIAGDFNLVINPIDRTGYFSPNTNDKIIFPKLISNFDLIDSYRYFQKKPLTKKLLASSKFQGISIGTSSLKVSHYADDLTLFISSPQSFSEIREIIEEFSLYSGLKINHSKTSNISNSPTLLSSFRSSFPQGKTLTSIKILGITFSFHKEDLSKNWDDLIRTLPHTTFATLNPKDSLFPKTISINQHFLPKIFFLSRIIPPTPKQIKTLTTLLFKFLWNFSPFELIKRFLVFTQNLTVALKVPCIYPNLTVALPFQTLDLKLPQPFYENLYFSSKTPIPNPISG